MHIQRKPTLIGWRLNSQNALRGYKYYLHFNYICSIEMEFDMHVQSTPTVSIVHCSVSQNSSDWNDILYKCADYASFVDRIKGIIKILYSEFHVGLNVRLRLYFVRSTSILLIVWMHSEDKKLSEFLVNFWKAIGESVRPAKSTQVKLITIWCYK